MFTTSNDREYDYLLWNDNNMMLEKYSSRQSKIKNDKQSSDQFRTIFFPWRCHRSANLFYSTAANVAVHGQATQQLLSRSEFKPRFTNTIRCFYSKSCFTRKWPLFKSKLVFLFHHLHRQNNIHDKSTTIDFNRFDVDNFSRGPSILPFTNNYYNLTSIRDLFQDDVYAHTTGTVAENNLH